jgi:hypothetical protein
VKATFGVEAIGLHPADMRLARRWGRMRVAVNAARPWLQELVGLDEVGGFRSVAVRERRDYRESNSAGTRGTWWWWTLDAGHIYETSYRSTWTQWHHRYITVTADGQVQDMTEEEVRACLRNVILG